MTLLSLLMNIHIRGEKGFTACGKACEMHMTVVCAAAVRLAHESRPAAVCPECWRLIAIKIKPDGQATT